MLKTKIKLIFTLFLCATAFLSSAALADMTCSAGGCSGVPWRVLVYPDGRISIFPMQGAPAIGGSEGPLSCTGADNNKAIPIPDSDPDGKNRVYSMVLASISAQKPIYIRTPDSVGSCFVAYIHNVVE